MARRVAAKGEASGLELVQRYIPKCQPRPDSARVLRRNPPTTSTGPIHPKHSERPRSTTSAKLHAKSARAPAAFAAATESATAAVG